MNLLIEQIVILALLFFASGFTVGKEKAEYKYKWSFWIHQEPKMNEYHKTTIILVTSIYLRDTPVWQKETNCGDNLSNLAKTMTDDWCDAKSIMEILKKKP